MLRSNFLSWWWILRCFENVLTAIITWYTTLLHTYILTKAISRVLIETKNHQNICWSFELRQSPHKYKSSVNFHLYNGLEELLVNISGCSPGKLIRCLFFHHTINNKHRNTYKSYLLFTI